MSDRIEWSVTFTAPNGALGRWRCHSKADAYIEAERLGRRNEAVEVQQRVITVGPWVRPTTEEPT